MSFGMPNIIVIMTDQHRPDFSAGEGFPVDTMPMYERDLVDVLNAAGYTLGDVHKSHRRELG